jgi:hypothetical protein
MTTGVNVIKRFYPALTLWHNKHECSYLTIFRVVRKDWSLNINRAINALKNTSDKHSSLFCYRFDDEYLLKEW